MLKGKLKITRGMQAFEDMDIIGDSYYLNVWVGLFNGIQNVIFEAYQVTEYQKNIETNEIIKNTYPICYAAEIYMDKTISLDNMSLIYDIYGDCTYEWIEPLA